MVPTLCCVGKGIWLLRSKGIWLLRSAVCERVNGCYALLCVKVYMVAKLCCVGKGIWLLRSAAWERVYGCYALLSGKGYMVATLCCVGFLFNSQICSAHHQH